MLLAKDDPNNFDYSSEEEDIQVYPLDYDKDDFEAKGAPYAPARSMTGDYACSREENPVIWMEIQSLGGRKLPTGSFTEPQVLGKLYFELRKDFCPVAVSNFLTLIAGFRGYGRDGVLYHYKGNRIHRVYKDRYFQSGDLIDSMGNCSRSTYNAGGLFRDENFILRHVGPGCLSMCNRGPDTNGSLFQVTLAPAPDLDERCVVFGCICSPDSYLTLKSIALFGTSHGEPKEELRITDCGVAYPKEKEGKL